VRRVVCASFLGGLSLVWMRSAHADVPSSALLADEKLADEKAQEVRERPERTETWVAFSGLGSAGLLPGFAAGFGVEVGRVWGRFGFSLLGRYWLPQEVAVADGTAKIRVKVLSLGLRACSFPSNEEWLVSGCLGAEIGDMNAEGVHIESARLRFDRWSALLAGLRVGRRVTEALIPLVGVEVAWALERPEFGVIREGTSEPAFRPTSFALIGYVGVAIVP
jgi:hypothetical protein